ncbi:MAG: hypothetical protein WBO35_01010 [Candidatus Saccharimonadales bacterium]
MNHIIPTGETLPSAEIQDSGYFKLQEAFEAFAINHGRKQIDERGSTYSTPSCGMALPGGDKRALRMVHDIMTNEQGEVIERKTTVSW